MAAAAAELAMFSNVTKDSIEIPTCALMIVCCNLPPPNDIPTFGWAGFIFNLLILKMAEGF